MATQYVILGSGQLNDRSEVAVHTETPGGVNGAGTLWTVALSESFGGTFNSVVPVDIMPGGRQAELDTGIRFEWVFTAVYDANDTNPDKLTEVESQLVTLEAVQLTHRQNELRFWGQTGTI
jgi:hypothetical protein